jgi:hypothetical protein
MGTSAQIASVVGQAGEASAEVAVEFANRQSFPHLKVQFAPAGHVAERSEKFHCNFHGFLPASSLGQRFQAGKAKAV